MGAQDEEGALSVESEEQPSKRARRWGDIALFSLGFITGCFVMVATCVGYVVHATLSMSADNDFLTAKLILTRPEVQRQYKLDLERFVGAHLPETTVVTRMRELFGPDSDFRAEFETSEDDAATLIARLDELRPVMSDKDIYVLRSAFDAGQLPKPMRAWLLPPHSPTDTFVIRLAEVRDGTAIWVVQDF